MALSLDSQGIRPFLYVWIIVVIGETYIKVWLWFYFTNVFDRVGGPGGDIYQI